MSSTFFGLTIAASGLNAAQAQINTTANNISNVETEGYSRQVVNTVAASALRCYQNYGTTGTGVEVVSVTQYRDLYYDEKYWNNQAELGYFDKKLYYMNQIEGFYSETNTTAGFTTIYTKLFNSISTLQTNSGDLTVREQVISSAKELTEYFNTTCTRLQDLQSSINDEIKSAVDEVNSIAEKISILNKQINVIEQGGGHANELRDRRALLVDELSTYASVDVKEYQVPNTYDPDHPTGATTYTIYIGGNILVDNYDYNRLKCSSRETDQAYNQMDVDGLYDIVWEKDGNVLEFVTSANTGSIKAMFEVRDGNNAENLSGYVEEATSNSVTIRNPSIKDINDLNLASNGAFWLDGQEYKYDEFSFVTNGAGEITSVTFKLDNKYALTDDDVSRVTNRKLQAGKEVNFMGIPYYQNQMNVFLRNFTEEFNKIERSGVDINGDPMGSVFVAKDLVSGDEHGMAADYDDEILSCTSETYYLLTAENIRIAYATDKDSSLLATTTAANYTSGQDAADLVVLLQDLQSKATIFRGGGGDRFLQCIYADVTVDTQECKVFSQNYKNIEQIITEQRQSISGVDNDEEALDLIKFQNAYNLASKCISVFSEIYDRLILETGV